MSTFADTLKRLPDCSHLACLELLENGECVARIENKPGQAGSLTVYAMLADTYGCIDASAAAEGLLLYGEHTADALPHPGKHPNIDRLLSLQRSESRLEVRKTLKAAE